MCGVVGRWRHDGGPVDAAELETMMATIVHRGPDDSGIWTAGHVGLGHRRLSILDLSAKGHQPMETPDGAGVLSYNGEIYNYLALREELEREGVAFRGASDSEVMLMALHHWGPERAIPLFNGMFAFAYFDRRSGALWLARDRLGIKQLYVAERDGETLFASEVKALAAVRRLAIGADADAVRRFFAGRREPHHTLYGEVDGLPPGSWWRLDADGTHKTRYFDVASELDVGRLADNRAHFDEAEAVSSLRDAFRQSVDLHLATDAPLAAMCSGGVDSSLIAAFARDRMPDLVAYVADVPPGSGEGRQAQAVADHIGMPIRSIPVDRKTWLRNWAIAVAHLDGPAYHASEPALLAVTKACHADGIKVLLTGEGADEMFGGYPWYGTTYRRWWRRGVAGRLGFGHGFPREHLMPLLSSASGGSFETRLKTALAVDANRDLAPGILHAKLSGVGNDAERAFLVACLHDFSGHMAWLLHRHDHMGMAASIEMRVPFIENRLIDLAIHLPYAGKRRHGRGKWIEKRLAMERLPRRLVLAPKKGFPVPPQYARGTERLLLGGRLPDLLGWTEATTAAVVDGLQRHSRLQLLAVGLELWLQMTAGGRSREEMGERLLALAA